MVTLNVFAADKQIFQFGKASSIAEIETKTNNVAIIAPTNGTPVNIDLKDLRRWMTNGLAPSNMVFTASNSLAAANLASSNALRTLTLTASNALRVDIDAGSGGGGGDVTRVGILNGSYPTGGKVRLIHAGVSTNSFTTITDAKNAAVAGDLVWVEAGNYYENNLLKSNVNYHFMPGVSIAWTNATDTEFGIFDDRATGTTTNTISGSADIYWRSPSSTDFSHAGIMLTNSNTRFIASFSKLIGDSFSTIGEQPHIIHASGSNSWVSIKADELLTGSVNQSGQVLGGIVWLNGEMFVNISHIGEFAGYGIWPSDPQGRSTNNLWVTSDLVECYIYADAATLNFRSWYDIKELRMTTNGTVKSGFAFFGGRHYVKCDKISSPSYFGASGGDGLVFTVTAGGEVWLDCQKLSRNGYSHTAIRVDSGTKLFANILHMEDVTTNTSPLIVNNGELWLSGVYYKGRAPLISAARTFTETFTRLSGVVAIATNDTAAVFADTNVTIVGSSLQSTIATNMVVFSGVATNADPFPAQAYATCIRSNSDVTTLAAFGYPLGDGYTPKPTVAVIQSSGVNVANNDTVTIGAKAYTFKTALTPTEGEVLIGASVNASLTNLIYAINHTGTDGVQYKCAVQNTNFSSAASVTAQSITVTSRSNRVWDVQETSGNLSVSFTQSGAPLPMFWNASSAKGFSVNNTSGSVTCQTPGLYNVRARVLCSMVGDNADYYNLDVYTNGTLATTAGGNGVLMSYAPTANLGSTIDGWLSQPVWMSCDESLFIPAGTSVEVKITAVQGYDAVAVRIFDYDARLTITHL